MRFSFRCALLRDFTIVSLIAVSSFCQPAHAVLKTFSPGIPTDYLWTLPANWSPVGVPAAGDVIRLNTTSGAPLVTMNYDFAGPTLTYQDLEVNSTGAGTMKLILPGTSSFATQFGQFIGNTGRGLVEQTGGTNSALSDAIWLGGNVGTRGTYLLNAGTLNTVGMRVGSPSGGEGILTVSGTSEVISTATINVFNTAGTVLNLSGGKITTTALNLNGSPGRFNWTGGELQVTGAGGASIGGVGATSLGNTLALGAGKTLTVDNTFTTNVSPGAFVSIEGGTLRVGSLDLIGNPSRLSWTSGTLHVTGAGGAAIGGPAVTNWLGSDLTVGVDKSLLIDSTLKVFDSGSAALILNGGIVRVGGLDLSGNVNRLNWTTGLLEIFSVNTVIDSTSAANLGSTLTLSTGKTLESSYANQVIGLNGTGTINQNSGFNRLTYSTLILGGNPGSHGVYNLSGGTLVLDYPGVPGVAGQQIGSGGTGIFNHTGGTNSGQMELSIGAGSFYNLSQTGDLSADRLTMNPNSNFVQTGGSATFNSVFNATHNIAGNYSLSGGAVNFLQTTSVAAGGSFNHSGGLATNKNLTILGAYNLSDAGLLTTTETTTVAAEGTFNHTGGTATNKYLDMEGEYNLSGTGQLTVTHGAAIATGATFTQNGGSVSLGGASSTQALLLGQYTLNSGSLTGPTNNFTSAFQLQQSGGIANFPILLFALDYSQSGGINNSDVINGINYQLDGGEVNVGELRIGLMQGTAGFYEADGQVSVSNGVVNAGTITLGDSPGGSTVTAALNLSGGTINAGALDFLGTPQNFNWTSGTLNITNNVTWDAAAAPSTTGSAFGASRTLSSNQTLQVTGNETLGGTGGFELNLNTGGTHIVTGDMTIGPTGILSQSTNSTLLTGETILAGGLVTGTLTNLTTFTYQGGAFSARLVNQGTLNLGPNFTAANGIQNDAEMTIASGQLVTASGAGFENRGTFTLDGGVLAGAGSLLNSAGGTMSAHGTLRNALVNNGSLTLDGTLIFTAGGVTNNGVVTGTGTLTGTFSNAAGGLVDLAGSLGVTNAWSNAGNVVLRSNSAALGGGIVTNTGTIEGTGFVNARITNTTGVVRASGGVLRLAASSNSNALGARIEASAGATAMYLQGLTTNSGTIALAGGAFDNNARTLTNGGVINGYGELRTGGLTNSASALVSVGGGDLNVLGTFTNQGTVSVQGGRTLYFHNNVTGAGSYTGLGSVVYLASLAPGNSPASINYGGNMTLGGASSLLMELGGTTPGTQYDQVHVAGQLAVGGTLVVSLINGFAPAANQSFDLLDWGALAGTFAQLQLPTLGGGLGWNTSQLYSTGVLSVVSVGVPGDYNNNGVVDAADYVLWRNGGPLANEVDTPGTVNAADYTAWRARFGNTSGSGAGLVGSGAVGGAVPEPTAAVLITTAILCVVWNSRFARAFHD